MHPNLLGYELSLRRRHPPPRHPARWAAHVPPRRAGVRARLTPRARLASGPPPAIDIHRYLELEFMVEERR